MSEPRVLQLKASKECFAEIISGNRQFEFREIKPFWSSRLDGKDYDEIHFRNGYSSTAPLARLKFGGVSIRQHAGHDMYAIRLGQLIEVANV